MDPRNTYAATKVAQEQLASVWARETGGTCTSLRLHNVYGPGMPRSTPYAGVAAIFWSAASEGKPPQVFEDGGQRRDFVHVDDVAQAFAAALARDEPATRHTTWGRGWCTPSATWRRSCPRWPAGPRRR